EVDSARAILDWAKESLEHHVELACLCELPAAIRTFGRIGNLVGAKSMLTFFAIDQRVGEVLKMSRHFPGFGMLQNRAVEPQHVGALLHHVAPPCFLDV